MTMNYCEECRKSFSTKYNLRRHRKTVHENKNSDEETDNTSEDETMETDNKSVMEMDNDKSSSAETYDKSAHPSKSASSNDLNSLFGGDNESFIDSDYDESNLGIEESERRIWQQLIIRAINFDKNFVSVKIVREL